MMSQSNSQPATASLNRSLKRINVFALVITLFIVGLGMRAIWVQGIDASGAAATALNNLKKNPQTIPATRGTITDRNGVVLAQTLPYVLIKADPYGIARNGIATNVDMTPEQIEKAAEAPVAIADILMKYLGGSEDDYLGHLTRAVRSDGSANSYEPIASNVPAYTWSQIKAAMNDGGWYGLAADSAPRRVYPDGQLLSNVLGFIGSDGQALAGFELSQNSGLSGTNGYASYEKSAYGTIPLGDNTLVAAINGDSYQLTIDAVVQMAAQQALAKKVAATHSDFGIAIVMDINTGEVLAMANAPTFNGNAFGSANQADTGNRAIQSQYEPGSVEKVLTVAALLDQGLITPDTKLVVPTGIKSGASTIHDSSSHPANLTARGVIAYSSNIGAIMLARQSDKATLRDYLSSFGLGRPTGIQLPFEAAGDLPENPTDPMRDSWAFGQSLSVTAIQEAAAVAAVTNGGVYHQPTIIKSVNDVDGQPVPQPDLATRRVISEEASAQVVNMMQAGTEGSNFGNSRALTNYSWMGKTGTASRYDESVKGYRGTTASFMAVAPVENPQYLVYVVLDNPSGGAAGGTIALPVAKDLMMVTLSHYGVPPSPSVPYTDPITYKP